MLSDAEALHALGETTWFPGWYVSGRADREGVQMVVESCQPSSSGEGMVDLRVSTYIPPIALQSLGALDDFVHWRLGRIMLHENDEWHKRRGVQVVRPLHAT